MLGLGNALKKVKSLVPKVVNAGKKAVKTAAKKVAHSALGRAVASIPSAVRAGAVKVGQITRKAVAAIPKIIEPIKRKAVEKVDQIKNSVTGKVAQIKKTVNTAVGQAKITVDQMQNAVDQKVSEFITVTEPKNKRIVEKLKAELANTYSDLMRGVTTQGASPEYILLTTSPILLEFFLKYRRAVIEEYPMLELPVPVLRGPLNFIRNQITNKGAAAGSFIYKQNIPGLSDFVGELTDQRGPGAESNAFSVVGAGVRGVVVKGLLGTVDGIATLIEDPVTALEGINSIVAHPDESIPAICDGVKTFWDDKVVNGSPEDRAEVVGQAVFEVATWLIGVGEVKTGTTVGKTAKMVQGAEKIDDISQVGKISKTLKLTKKAELVKDSLRIAKSTVIEKTASKINKAWLKNLGKATAKSFDDAIMKAGKKTGNIIDDIRMGMNKGPKLAFETVGDFDSLSNTGDLITDYLSNVKKMVKNKLDSTGNHKVNIKPKVEADDLSKSIKKSGDGPGAIAEGTGKSINNFADDALEHASRGEFTYNPKTGEVSKMKGGGHGQENLEMLDSLGIDYNIEKTYPNGVRVGNVPGHKVKLKRAGIEQSWFPESWDANKIQEAGNYVIEANKGVTIKDGAAIFADYDGVKVGVIYTDGKPATIFPNAIQPE